MLFRSKRCDVIAVDSRGTASRECGDLLPAVEKGWRHWDSFSEMGDILAGKERGRSAPGEVTLYESHGMGILDLWVGARMLELARERGIGTELPIGN